MSKSIFILFLFFSSLYSFSQKVLPNDKMHYSEFSSNVIKFKNEKEKKVNIQKQNESEIDLLLKDNLCEILSLKISDLLNESMLKKKNAIV
ncbi:hypothetical protein MCETHM1_00821 [Flavobacteriaceae bacterium]